MSFQLENGFRTDPVDVQGFAIFTTPDRGSKRREAKALVHMITSDTSDMLSIMSGLDTAMIGIGHNDPGNKAAGAEVFTGIASYLERSTVMMRTVLPPSPNFLDNLSRSRRTIDRLRNAFKQENLLGQLDGYAGLVEAFNAELAAAGQTSNYARFFLFSEGLGRNGSEESGRKLEMYREMADLINIPQVDTYDPDQAKQALDVPGKLITNAEEASTIPASRIPDIYTSRFRNISLEKLMSESDPERFCRNAMQYLGAVPQDNLLWKGVAERILYQNIGHVFTIAGSEFAADIEKSAILTKVFSYQWWMMQKMLMPMLDSSYRDPQFDRSLTNLVSGVSETGSNRLIAAVIRNATAPLLVNEVRDNAFSLSSGDIACPLQERIFNEMGVSALSTDHSEFPVIATDFFKLRSNEIADSLRKRLGKGKNTEQFIAMFQEELINKDARRENTENVYASIQEHTGKTVRDAESALGLYISAHLGDEDQATLSADQTHLIYEVTLNNDGFREHMGIENVLFSPTYNDLSETAFVVRLGDTGIGVAGITDIECKNIRFTNVTFDSKSTIGIVFALAVSRGFTTYVKYFQNQIGENLANKQAELDEQREVLLGRQEKIIFDRKDETSSLSIDPDEVLENLRRLLQEETEKGEEE